MVKDIEAMHKKMSVYEEVDRLAEEGGLSDLLRFRVSMLTEEYEETLAALRANDPEEVVDGLTDMLVVILGTMDLFDIDAPKAWDQVMAANLAKEPGIKPGRPNPLGLPDLMKPPGWEAPSHEGNHGLLPKVLVAK
tara:strand:- start:4393 stop:4800 length:408 start_codon:yes stop_codon:yes gene_type:complete